MLKVENVETYGWEAAIRGMRNPMNSWEKSDTKFYYDDYPCVDIGIGPNDKQLMQSLQKGGPVHAKFRRMINITMDITAPLYWWKEFDTYKVGTVANSCSTMHKIQAKEFTINDFSCEHLINLYDGEENEVYDYCTLLIKDIFPTITTDMECELALHKGADVILTPFEFMKSLIILLNEARRLFLETNDKKFWWQMIQLLPSSYNQKRTVQLNYEVAAHIYPDRKDHKLDEWHVLCDELKNLPYSWLITGEDKND